MTRLEAKGSRFPPNKSVIKLASILMVRCEVYYPISFHREHTSILRTLDAPLSLSLPAGGMPIIDPPA